MNRLRVGHPRYYSRHEQGSFLLSKASRAVGSPNRPDTHCLTWIVSLGIEWLGRDDGHQLHLV